MHYFKHVKLFAFFLMFGLASCQNDENVPTNVGENKASQQKGFEITFLVSDEPDEYPGARFDPNLVNAWGIAVSSFGSFWVSAEGSGTSPVYDRFGADLLPAVTIPDRNGVQKAGHPTGQLFNTTSDFVMSNGRPARFIFAGADGSITGWNGGPAAELLATSEEGEEAAYLGIAMASNGGQNYLYVANFAEGEIEVYDKNFDYVDGIEFEDPSLPEGYSPFNVQAIDGKLYVMYAKQSATEPDEEEIGPGLGIINVFNPDGSMIMRFATGGTLNAPWGIAKSHSGFGEFKNAIMIGNFGDGTIAGYKTDGTFIGQLHDKAGGLVVVEGLWGILFTEDEPLPDGNPNLLYFAAGPDDEEHGTFGYIQHK
jgi:uncharacterized protein (TIGR03118 family)